MSNIECVKTSDIELLFGREGRRDWAKFSFPVLYGQSVQAKWGKYLFDFDLNGALKKISGFPPTWPNQLEQLKRTMANTYIYYGIFGYEATYHMLKNYYVPFNGTCDPPVFNEQPFAEPHIQTALEAFDRFVLECPEEADRAESRAAAKFLRKIASQDRAFLAAQASRLHEIIGGSVPVLPPDTLLVDYEVIPVLISDGCLYGCRFCGFGNKKKYSTLDHASILSQLNDLKEFYGEDLSNYNSVFIGQNDALAAGAELVEFAAMASYEILELKKSYHHGAFLFLFASADSLLNCSDKLFQFLNSSPYETHINIGLESPSSATLRMLGKPLTSSRVREAFMRAGEINKKYEKINVSTNFVLGQSLPPEHLESVISLLSSAPVYSGRDTVYLSPLMNDCERMQIRDEFTEIKRRSRPDVFLYTIQSM